MVRPEAGILSQKGVLALDETRDRLVELIRMMPEDKLQVVIEFVNRLFNDAQEGEDPDDELLMT